jgi:hypothetical protein
MACFGARLGITMIEMEDLILPGSVVLLSVAAVFFGADSRLVDAIKATRWYPGFPPSG